MRDFTGAGMKKQSKGSDIPILRGGQTKQCPAASKAVLTRVQFKIIVAPLRTRCP